MAEIVKVNIGMILGMIGGCATLASGGYFVWDYFDSLATKQQLAALTIDATIASTEQRLLILEFHGETNSSRYEHTKARLINLEAQRDELLGVGND